MRGAFHTEIHDLEVNGAAHIANMSDPRIPTALAPAIVGVVSLNDFRPHAMNKPRPGYTFAGCGDLTNSRDCYTVVPADLATIYNLNPLFAAGYSGQGQTILVIEDSDLYQTSDWTTFRSVFGLASYVSGGSLSQVHPGCTDPGVNDDDSEAAIDVEWSSAAAPNAAIEMAACASTQTTFGGFFALANILNDLGNAASHSEYQLRRLGGGPRYGAKRVHQFVVSAGGRGGRVGVRVVGRCGRGQFRR